VDVDVDVVLVLVINIVADAVVSVDGHDRDYDSV